MPDSKAGNDLGVFDDLLKNKPEGRVPSQPLEHGSIPTSAFDAPVPIPPPPAWFGAPPDPAQPASIEAEATPLEPSPQGPASISPILAPTVPVDDGGWDEGPADASAKPDAPSEPVVVEAMATAAAAAAQPVALAAPAEPAAVLPAPATTSASSSWGDDLVPVVRSSRGPVPTAVRLSGVPLPPPSSRLPPPPSRLTSVPKLAPPPTLGSTASAVSSLAPGSLAPPVLTAPAFTSPLSAAPPAPPPRRSIPQPAERATASDVIEAGPPRRMAAKQTWVIAATLAAGIGLGFVVRGSGGSAAASPTATLKAAAGQPGVKLIIDGREVGPLPREISGLTPGEHLVAFEGDRYASAKKVLIFGPSEIKQLDPERLKVVRGAATFDVKTPGAALVLVTDDERRELSDYSLPVDIDATKSWTLEASKPGYDTLRMPVTFGDQTAKTFSVTLGESQKPDKAEAVALNPSPSEPHKAAQAAALPAEPKTAENTPATHKSPPPEAPRAAATEAPTVQTSAGTCKLNVNSIPVSKVLLDGRPIGLTPRVGVVVPAGPHTVVFVGENARKSASPTCQAGETKAVSMHR